MTWNFNRLLNPRWHCKGLALLLALCSSDEARSCGVHRRLMVCNIPDGNWRLCIIGGSVVVSRGMKYSEVLSLLVKAEVLRLGSALAACAFLPLARLVGCAVATRSKGSMGSDPLRPLAAFYLQKTRLLSWPQIHNINFPLGKQRHV